MAAGEISKSELAQLKSQVSNDQYLLVTAQTNLENYKLQLKQMLELEDNQNMNLDTLSINENDILSPLPAKKDVYQTALALRPEIQSSKTEIQSADLNVRMAKAGYMPTVSLSAGIGTNHSSGSNFTFSEQVKNGWNNSIGLTLSLPLFSNRETKSAIEKAKIQYESSQLDLTNAQKSLYKEIESIWLDASSAQQQFVAAESKLKSCRSSYELINEQFSLGMKNIIELLTEKNNLMSAQQERIQAKYMALLNRTLLTFYSGKEIDL